MSRKLSQTPTAIYRRAQRQTPNADLSVLREKHTKYQAAIYVERRSEITARRQANRPHYHNRELIKKYNITLDDYNTMLARCGYVCEICKQPETKAAPSGAPYNLSVDHSHITGQVRGILCSKCNLLIGRVNDSISILESSIEYLKRFI